MGTRNLTAVFIDGEYKVAQYGQWDGYPEGQGMTALHFLREEMDEAVQAPFAIRPSLTGRTCETTRSTEWEDGLITLNDADRMKKDYPEFSRDTGAGSSAHPEKPEGLKLESDIGFAADSLFCEWAWVIDFDAGTFEAYEGFNQKGPLEEGTASSSSTRRRGYYPVKKVAEWKLDNLPSDEDFLAAFKEEE